MKIYTVEITYPGKEIMENFVKYDILCETCAVMQPGPELDALVARVIGIPNIYMDFSTNVKAAMEAWAWLEENNPWQPYGVALQRSRGKPAVFLTHYDDITLTAGETYPHAISLAVVGAGLQLGLIDI